MTLRAVPLLLSFEHIMKVRQFAIVPSLPQLDMRKCVQLALQLACD